MATGESIKAAPGDARSTVAQARMSRRHTATIGILVVGTVLSIIAFQIIDRIERDRVGFIFNQAAADRLFAIEDRIQFNVEVIRAVVGFYESSSFVDRDEFSSFASPALFRRRSFQVLAWIPRVTSDEVPKFVERALNDGFPDFEIHSFDRDGNRVARNQSEESYPIYYVEPILGNEVSIGRDILRDPNLREALLLARDTGEITVTAQVPFGDVDEGEFATLIFAPVYEVGKPLDGIDLRRQFVKGFVLGSMQVGDAVQNALEERTPISRQGAAGIDFYLYDATAGEAVELLHVRSARNRGEPAPELALNEAQEGQQLSHDFSIGGRRWVAVARPSTPLFLGVVLWEPWAAALVGFGFTLLLAWFLNIVVKRREFAEALVVERTSELQASERALLDKAELLTLLHSIADAANQASSLEEAIEFCLSRICRFTRWPVGHAFLRQDDESPKLISTGLWHLDDEDKYQPFKEVTQQLDFRVGETLPGVVVATGRPRWITPASDSSSYYRGEVVRELGLFAGFAIPIMIRNRAVGALEFFTEQAEDPNEDLIQAWMQIGTHLGRVAERVTIDRMKSEFVSTVSHELRTPLTSIQGSLGLLQGGALGTVPDEMAKLVEIAYSNSDRLVRLINDILDIEKIESGRMDYNFAPHDLNDVVLASIEANQSYADRYRVTFRPPMKKPKMMVKGDRDRLIQVMANLLSNAAKFSPEDGEVQINCEAEYGRAKVSVVDFGPGISSEFRSRIFGKFAQADSSDTRNKGGTGLGLSICKAIIEHHGGEIGFQSEPSSGSTFYFYLPLIETDSDTSSMDAPDGLTGKTKQQTLAVEEDRTS